jgi:hypothetical protein
MVGSFEAIERTEQDMKGAIDKLLNTITNLPNAGEEESE